MVEVISGAGLGLERTSALLLGSGGGVGSPALGRADSQAYVNSDTGNLVVQDPTELLTGIGVDAALGLTYNSLGQRVDENGDNWATVGSQIVNLTGSVNTSGSTVQRLGWDGSLVTYTYDAAKNAYTVKEQSGAYDVVNWTGSAWKWTEGSTQITETYNTGLGNRVASRADIDGNTVTYSYTGNLLTKATTADGEYATLSYTGNNLTQVQTTLNGGATYTRTRYTYDAQNRLSSITFDLSPSDNSTADGNTYVTTYSYVNTTSALISSIQQSDGSRLDVTYDASNRVASTVQWVSPTVSRTTTYAYATGTKTTTDLGGNTINLTGSTVTDPQGNVTTLWYDTKGFLWQVYAPPAVSGGNAQITDYKYDGFGNLLRASVYDGQANQTAGTALNRTDYAYDTGSLVTANPFATAVPSSFGGNQTTNNGNLLRTEDLLGNTTDYTYNAANQVLTRTNYTGTDADGLAGTGNPGGTARTTFYVYDANKNLAFTVSPEGRVVQYIAAASGLVSSEIDFAANLFSTASYSPSNLIPLATLTSWVAGISDKSTVQRTDYTYDIRGNVQTQKTFSKCDAAGNGLTTSDYTLVNYVYDPSGKLTSRLSSNTTQAETYQYDGLWRLTQSTDLHNGSSTISWGDNNIGTTQSTILSTGQVQSVTTLANGLVQTTVYDRAGELVSVATSGTGVITGTTSYAYDSLGLMRIKTDADGVKSYFVYDKVGRVVGDIDGNGYLTAYLYDAANRQIGQIEYANALSAAQIASLTDGSGNPANPTLASLTPTASANDRYRWNVYDASGRLVETIDPAGSVVAYAYDGANQRVQQTAYATQLTATQVNGFRTTPPTAQVLPTAVAASDRTIRSFYSNDGLLIGVLDADGYLTQYDYDAAGRQVDTVRYANAASSTYWATGTFAQLQGSITASGADQRNYTIYDGRGFAAATIDGEGNLTRYHYTARGDVDQIVRGQQVSPNTVYTLATLPTAPGGTVLETTNFTRNGAGQVLTQVKALAGTGTETTAYTYDVAGNLLTVTTSESISGDTRTSTNVYDVKGRLIVTLSGIGSYALAQLGASPTQAQINSIYASYGIRYSYDAANRLISKVEPDGQGGAGNTTLYYYDNNGQLRAQINALGEVTEYRYTGLGQRSDVIVYATRLSSTTLASLSGGLVNATLTTALSGLASSADTVSHYDYNVTGTLADSVAPFVRTGLSQTTTYSYDAFGEEISRTAPVDVGVTTTTVSTYNRRGLLASSLRDSTALALSMSYGYDGFGRLTSSTDANGTVRTTAYDRNNRVVSQVDGLSQTSSLGYDARGNLITSTDRNGKVTTFAYDAFSRNITTTTPEGVVTTVKRDAYGDTIQITDGAGRTTTYAYNRNGSLNLATNAAGSASKVYDMAGRLVDEIDAKGVDTHYTYDAANRVLTRVQDYGSGKLNLTTTYVYDAKGEVVRVTDPTGVVTTYGYDPAGDRVSVNQDVNGLNIQTTYVYRADGKITDQTDAVGTAAQRTTHFVYDAVGRNTQKIEDYGTGKLNVTTSYAYDADNNVVAVTDALSRVTHYVYDADNRLIYSVDAMGEVTQTGYDAEGRVVSTRAFAATVPTATLNGFGLAISASQITAAVSPSAADQVNRTLYDGNGRAVYQVDGEGYVAQNVYDGANNIVQTIRYTGAVSVTDTVTTASLKALLPATVPSDAVVTSFAYDTANRLTDVTDATGMVIHYVLDALGQITDTTVAYGTSDAATTHRVFDNLGRVTSETRGFGTAEASTTGYTYDGLGRVTAMTDGDGYVRTNTYDALGRLIQTSVPVDANSAHNIVTQYQYDARGNRVAVTDPRGNTGYFYYDNLDRLVLQVDPLGFITATAYSIGGNISSVTHYATAATNSWSAATRPNIVTGAQDETTSFTRDKLDRVTSTTDAAGFTESYVLDAFGNRTQLTNKLGGITTYTYDRRNLLKSQTVTETSTNSAGTVTANTVTTNYTYDSRGNRLTMVEAAGLAEQRTTNYAYDKLDRLTKQWGDQVATLLATNITASPNQLTVVPATIYTYDRRGNRIATINTTDASGTTGPTTFTYFDHLNRKIGEVSPVGTLAVWAYDANSNVISQTTYGDAVALPSVAGGAAPSPVNAGNYRQTLYSYDRNNRLVGTTVQNMLVGAWNGSSYVTTTRSVSLASVYDASGNVIQTTDGNGTSTYHWFDKVGHETASLDGAGYLTTWTRDQDGNVLTEIRYANAVTGTISTASVPSVTADGTNDRVTQFTYDRMGRRLTETRLNVAISTVGASDTISTANGSATITYTYNGLGEVLSKREATTDTTTYTYDSQGRQIQISGPAFTDYTGTNVQQIETLAYDGLNDVTRTVGNSVRVTSYTYGAGGRLQSMTDASGFTTSYYYDAMGRQTVQMYARVRSDGSVITEARLVGYDAAGRVNYQGMAANPSAGVWTYVGDSNTATYDTYSEVTARLLNGVAQERFIYDAMGHVVASNQGDGSWKAYVNDANGNATLTITSNGTTDLSTLTQAQALALATNNGANAAGAAAGNGVNVTIGVFNGRNQQTETRAPLRDSVLDGQTAVTQNLIDNLRTYNAFGEVASQTDARGNTTNFTYTTEGKLASQVNPLVNVTGEDGGVSSVHPTQYSYYDASGRLIGTRDANGNLITRALLAGTGYGGSDALVTTEYHPDGGSKTTGYDVFLDDRKDTNELGQVTTNTYDAMDRLIEVDHPLRANGTPGGDGVTQLKDYYAYDGLGQRIQHWDNVRTNPIYTVTTTTYAAGDTVTTVSTGPYGPTYTTQTLTAPMTVTTATVTSTVTAKETLDYDAQGRIISAVDFSGHQTTTSYTWNSARTTSGLGSYGGWDKVVTYVDAAKSLTDTIDSFGHEIYKSDLAGTTYAFTFDKLGHLTAKTSSAGENLAYTYFNSGLVKTIVDNSNIATSSYYTSSITSQFTYDRNGNRLTSNYTSVSHYQNYYYGSYFTTTYATVMENSTATYDALNRIISVTDPGDAANKRPSYTLTRAYDANGNIREAKAVHQNVDSNQNLVAVSGTPTTSTDDYWYRYDSMNRFIITKGSLSGTAGAAGTTITSGTNGLSITYNAAGQRTSAMTSSIGAYGVVNTNQELYAYTADGYLSTVSVAMNFGTPTLEASDTRDALGRVTAHTEYNSSGGAVVSRTATYNSANQVISDSNTTVQGSDTWVTTDTYTYGQAVNYSSSSNVTSYTGSATTSTTTSVNAPIQAGTYANGQVVSQSSSTSKNGTYQYSNAISNTFTWSEGPQQLGISNTYSGTQTGTTTSTFNYDKNNHVTQVTVTGQAARTLSYTTDSVGQVMARKQTSNGSTTAPEQFYFYFNGVQIGQIGNNGDDNTNYAAAIYLETTPSGSGPFVGGGTTGASSANFDEDYQAMNPTAAGEAGSASSYTVQSGDTLAGIAAQVWGDSSLWYVIAQANGIQSDNDLAAGMQISIPNKVENLHNNSTTFKVYNPAKALGDVQPGAPVPPSDDNGFCGVIGEIIKVVLVAVDTIIGFTMLGPLGAALGAAWGDAEGQAINMLMGNQKKFNFGEVGLSAISGFVGGEFQALGVGAAITKEIGSKVVGDVITGALSNAVTQGVSVATGLQDHFDWGGVALAGIGAGVTGVVSRSLDASALNSSPHGGVDLSVGTPINSAISGIAGGIANAATRSLITGTDFGDNLMRALPSIIGNTIGGLVGDEVNAGLKAHSSPKPSSNQGGTANATTIGNAQTGAAPAAGDTSGAGGQDGSNGAPTSIGIQEGQTLQSIADTHGTTVDALKAVNPQITNPDLIYANASLTLPAGVAPIEGDSVDIVVTASSQQKWDNAHISNIQFSNINRYYNPGNVFHPENIGDENAAIHEQAVRNNLMGSFAPLAMRDTWVSGIRYFFPNAHSIGIGGSAELAIGGGVHLGIAYRYDLDTGAHGGTLDWGGGIGAAGSIGGGPFVSKDSFIPKALTSTTISSSIGGEFGPASGDISHIWKQRINGVDVPIENPNEKSIAIFGYDILNGTASPSHKTSENITVENGHVTLRTDTSPIIPTTSSVKDSLESIGAHAYLFNLNVHKSF